MTRTDNRSIIVLDKFIQATRDSGYRGTVSAIAELVDNSLQAGATDVRIRLTAGADGGDWPIEVGVWDNGSGMDRSTLRQALRFGGSTRFNDRHGLGRYGMGLPNASLSQARRVDVYSWQKGQDPLYCYLDVDEIASGRMAQVPDPRMRKMPDGWRPTGRKGTLVHWKRCDRLDHRRITTVTRKLTFALGRIFRYFLWEGVRIRANDTEVTPVDPLYLRKPSLWTGGSKFDSQDLEIRVPSNNGTGEKVGRVTVTFSELPVAQWHGLSNDEKRRLGISNGAGVSVVRAGREIEYGWFFMGGKRKENYDDWWRCEVRFDPALDEAFGITHTKQQIHPQDYLIEILAPEMEGIAKALNNRVRKAHLEVNASEVTGRVEQMAAERDTHLKPLPNSNGNGRYADVWQDLIKRHPVLKDAPPSKEGVEYRIIEDAMNGTSFYQPVLEGNRLVVTVNPRHRFHKLGYGPLMEAQTPEGKRLSAVLQAMLLAAGRAEVMATKASEQEAVARFRRAWSEALEVFLRE